MIKSESAVEIFERDVEGFGEFEEVGAEVGGRQVVQLGMFKIFELFDGDARLQREFTGSESKGFAAGLENGARVGAAFRG